MGIRLLGPVRVDGDDTLRPRDRRVLAALGARLGAVVTAAQVAAFRGSAGDVVVGFDHPNYGHMAVMPQAVRQALSADFS